MLSFGVAYRYKSAMALLLKYKLKDMLVFGYSYDIPMSKLSLISNGAHELMISYRFEMLPPGGKKETHPRFYF